MTLHVFANFVTPFGTAANNRAETEGNMTTLQKLLWMGETHSTVSADARPDLGVIAKNARAAGLNAVFLTDHNQASDFPISSRTANLSFFDVSALSHDDLNRWTTVGSGVTQVSSPVHSGSAATRLVSTGSTEQYLYTVRGPNLRPGTGAVTTTFSVYPTRKASPPRAKPPSQGKPDQLDPD